MSSRRLRSSGWKATYRIVTGVARRPRPSPPPAVASPPPRPPARWPWSRAAMIVGLVALAAGLAFVGIRGYVHVRRLIAATEEVDRCRVRLAGVRDVVARLRDAETGQRGYLLTGRPGYLARYDASRAELLAGIDALLRDDPGRGGERATLERARIVAAEKFAEMGRTIALHDAGRRDEAIALVEAGVGERLKREFLDLVAAVEQAESGPLEEARAEAARHSDLTPSVLLGLLVGTLVVVFGLCEAMAREVRERRKAEAVLRESEGRFRGSFEAAAVGMALVSPEGRFLKVNRSICQIVGYEEHELLARDFQSITHPDDLDADLALFRRALGGEIDTYQMEKRYIHRGGRTIHIVLAVSLVRDDAGRPLHVVAQVQDITPRVLAEREAVEERRFIAKIAGAVPSILYVYDLDRRRNVWANEQIGDVLGYDPAQIVAMGEAMLPRLVHPDELPRLLAHHEAMRSTPDGEVREIEFRAQHADGSWRWLRGRELAFRRGGDGRVAQVVGAAEDVTERRREQAELARARTQLADAIESLDAGLVMFDADERLVICNRRFRAMYPDLAGLLAPGVTYEQIIRAAARAYPPDLAEAEAGLDDEGRVQLRLEHFRRRKGTSYEVGVGGRWSRIGEFATSECGTVCLVTDISDLKRHEEELRRARDAAQAAARAKAEFLANMSHEIRTPMNGVLGMAELALATPLGTRQREYVAAIKTSAESLLTVINDILDFSKIEAGKLEIDRAPFGLRALVDDTLRTFAPRAHEKGLELCARVSTAAPDVLVGDPHRLRQVLVNLVGNAIKFTERGEVVLSVGPGHGQGAGAGDRDGVGLEFSVRDTGIGIPADRREAIFAPFEQADGSTTRRYGGTGLGLTISARLVALMGGRIRAEEAPGGGSLFRFTAWFGRLDGEEVPAAPSSLAGRPALIVDDHATGRAILAEMLAGWGMEPTAVASASSASSACRAAREAGRPFAAAVVAGEAAARELAGPGAAPPIIVLDPPGAPPAGGGPSVAARLAKPVRQSELFNALTTLLGDPAAPGATPEAPAAPDVGGRHRPLRVLLAEDHPVNQVVATRMLERLGHRAVVADDGRDALAAMESGLFDLVLMDLQMPVMDGFQALAAIRDLQRSTGSAPTPVFALTAHAMAGDRERCLAAGFDGYLSKPIRADDLGRALAELAAAPPAPAPGLDDGEAAPPTFDPGTLAESCDGDAEIIADVLDSFVAEAPADLARIVRALADDDLDAARRAAHGVKGACATVGAVALASACRRIEQLPDGATPPRPEAVRAALDAAWWPLVAAIEAHREAAEPARAAN